mmetsp:Transcript_23300/g.53960  ORF Transcript_23300/g.53960 Transcript_23300/m.53960 type:complete len:295 (+) Transcript_23300:119-1003(+)
MLAAMLKEGAAATPFRISFRWRGTGTPRDARLPCAASQPGRGRRSGSPFPGGSPVESPGGRGAWRYWCSRLRGQPPNTIHLPSRCIASRRSRHWRGCSCSAATPRSSTFTASCARALRTWGWGGGGTCASGRRVRQLEKRGSLRRWWIRDLRCCVRTWQSSCHCQRCLSPRPWRPSSACSSAVHSHLSKIVPGVGFWEEAGIRADIRKCWLIMRRMRSRLLCEWRRRKHWSRAEGGQREAGRGGGSSYCSICRPNEFPTRRDLRCSRACATVAARSSEPRAHFLTPRLPLASWR